MGMIENFIVDHLMTKIRTKMDRAIVTKKQCIDIKYYHFIAYPEFNRPTLNSNLYNATAFL